MNLHDFASEQVSTAAPVLAMSDTCFLSVSVANLWFLKFHVSGSVVSVAAEHLLESCGSGRVSRGEWWKVYNSTGNYFERFQGVWK